ncbi:hypothetical protein, partial [Acidithiobacillus sp.]|uniref:hypothetical protein n=1 Tax=Acidithiobacillus sp. TaxID=1872118 RepID=UPI003D03F8D1
PAHGGKIVHHQDVDVLVYLINTHECTLLHLPGPDAGPYRRGILSKQAVPCPVPPECRLAGVSSKSHTGPKGPLGVCLVTFPYDTFGKNFRARPAMNRAGR